MSYGPVYIEDDLKKGYRQSQLVKKLIRYYPEIPEYRAKLLVGFIKKHGADAKNPYWKSTKQEKLWKKRFNVR